MHSINPPAKFHICHVPCPGRLWPQAGQTQGLKQKKPNPLKITSVSSMTLGCALWTAQGSVCKSPAAATEPSELAGAEQSLGRAGMAPPWQHLQWPTQGRNLLGSPELHRGRVTAATAAWGAQQGCRSSSPSTGVQESTEKEKKKGKGKEKWKGSAVFQTWLSQQVSWLSVSIPK